MPIPVPLLVAVLAAAQPVSPPLAELRWQRRAVLVSAPAADDPGLATQRRAFARLQGAATDRDLILVAIIGDAVTGSSDTAAALRRTYRLPANRFAVILIGKDGGTKARSDQPFSAAELVATIDAMPMRRGGNR